MNNNNNNNNTSSSSIDSAILYSAMSASFFATSLLALQSDFLSRKFLSPLKLYAKRRQDQIYKLDKAISESIQRIRYHVNEGHHIDSSVERQVMDLILEREEIHKLVKDMMIACSTSSKSRRSVSSAATSAKESAVEGSSIWPPLIVGISKDLNIAKDQYYIHLAFALSKRDHHGQQDSAGTTTISSSSSNTTHVQYGRRVQMPLLTFCETLATEFESTLTSTAMCFIADASSSLSSRVFSALFQKCSSCLEIPLVQEPAWMTTVALLLRRKEITEKQAEKILYSLCRMQVLKLEWEQRIGSRHKTVVFVLPGQGCTAVLLPLLQKIFPCERHVFAYDGCVDSVKRGTMMGRWNKKRGVEDPASLVPFYGMERSASAVVPLVPMMKKLPQLPDLLAKLSKDMASVVEAWMNSVDAMIELKENEKKNMYTPFVCRMEFLLKGENVEEDNGVLMLEERGRLALCNVLQYITGSRSRALDDATLDAAQSVLMDLRREWRKEVAGFVEMSQSTRTEIEDCVFLHKMILIGDKTLPDTVIPKVEWSLKAAKKLTSCACCFPGEEGEGDDEDGSQAEDKEDNEVMVDEFAVSTVKSTASRNTTYVDGKSKFAFDPSVFTGMK